MFDRIDLTVETPPVTAADMALPPPAEGTAEASARVLAARAMQEDRLRAAASTRTRLATRRSTPAPQARPWIGSPRRTRRGGPC